MNDLSFLLSELNNKYNAVSLRCDIAAEIYTDYDIKILCDLAQKNNFPLTIKIGGCDSMLELHYAKKYGASSIIAPMIETPYALKKFVDNCRKIYSDSEIKNINLYPNIETITAYNNINEILSIPEVGYIKGIVLGRDDMADSIGTTNINSDKMLEISNNIFSIASKYNIDFIIWGGIRPNAVDFLNKLPKIKYYETRMIVFDGNYISEEGIKKAIEFEIKWLKRKQIKNDFDNERIFKLQNEIFTKLI